MPLRHCSSVTFKNKTVKSKGKLKSPIWYKYNKTDSIILLWFTNPGYLHSYSQGWNWRDLKLPHVELKWGNKWWIILVCLTLEYPHDHKITHTHTYTHTHTFVQSASTKSVCWLNYFVDVVFPWYISSSFQAFTPTASTIGQAFVVPGVVFNTEQTTQNKRLFWKWSRMGSQSVSISLWKVSSGRMHSISNRNLWWGHVLALWVDRGNWMWQNR